MMFERFEYVYYYGCIKYYSNFILVKIVWLKFTCVKIGYSK